MLCSLIYQKLLFCMLKQIISYIIALFCVFLFFRFKKKIQKLRDSSTEIIGLYLHPFFFFPIIFFCLHKLIYAFALTQTNFNFGVGFVSVLIMTNFISIMNLLNSIIKYGPEQKDFLKIIQSITITMFSLSLNFAFQYNIMFDYENASFTNIQKVNWWTDISNLFFYSFSIMTNSSISDIKPISFYTKLLSCVEVCFSFIVIMLILANYQVIGESLRKYFNGNK